MYGVNATLAANEVGTSVDYAAEPHEEHCEKIRFSEFLDQDASRFFYRWGGELSSILIRTRARFDGDLDQYLLYLIFLLAELQQAASGAEAQARGEPVRPRERKGMNALS